MTTATTIQSTLGELYNPPHASTWQKVSLYTLADWINGLAFKNVHFSKSGKPVIKIAEIKHGITEQTQFTDSEYDPKVHISKGDVLFAWSGQPETSIGVSVWQGEDGWLNQHIFKILAHNNVDKDFFFLLLKYLNPYFIRIAKNKQTTGLGHVTKEDLRAMQVGIPSINEQRELAKVMMPLDYKIELLHKQNEILEQTAQTIFNEWFGTHNVSNTIPRDWKTYLISDIADVVPGYSYKGADLVSSSEVGLVNLKNFDRNGGFKISGLKAIAGSPKPSQEVQIGDVVVAHTDITQDAEVLGNAALILDTGIFQRLYISMDVAKVVPKNPLTSGFLYFLMRTRTFKQHCVSYANGTTVLHLPRIAVPQYQVVLPIDLTAKIVTDFNGIADATIKKMTANIQAIQTLNATREVLLPRLMNGEITL